MKKSKLKTDWDLSLIFKSEKEIKESRKLAELAAQQFSDKWEKRSDYLEKPEILKEALDDYEKFNRNHSLNFGEFFYFELKHAISQNDPKIKAAFNQSTEVFQNIQNKVLFFAHRISKIEKTKRDYFLKSNFLRDYRYFLKKIFDESDYLLSEPEEKILNLKSEVAMGNWVKMTEGFLAKEEAEIISDSGKKEKIPFSELFKIMESTKKKVRDSGGKEINRILEKWSDVAEAEINSILADKKIDDELRKIDRPDFARYLSDGVETEIADAITKAVNKNLDLAKRFYKLRAKLEGVEKLEYWERSFPYGKSSKKYFYEESVELIKKVFAKLDPQFLEIFEQFINKGQIDVFPKKGKTSGAFCAHGRIVDPVYVLLNHSNTIHDVLTIAHEMGHAINDELMKKQNALNFGTPLFSAETASTFMEDFVLEELINGVDEETKLSLMVEKLKNEVATIFRQVVCANFERELHKKFREKGYLSKKEIGEIFKSHMNSYMGSAIKQSPGAENWWIYWSHIRNFFYTYSYASGLLISKKLQLGIKENSEYINEVKKFLSAGSSDSPKNIFMRIGADISNPEFWEEGILEFKNLLDKTEKLAKKLGKI